MGKRREQLNNMIADLNNFGDGAPPEQWMSEALLMMAGFIGDIADMMEDVYDAQRKIIGLKRGNPGAHKRRENPDVTGTADDKDQDSVGGPASADVAQQGGLDRPEVSGPGSDAEG